MHDISAALHSGFVDCAMTNSSPPLVKLSWLNHECTALVRHALLASLWKNTTVVVTSSVVVMYEKQEMLVVLGIRLATPNDMPAAAPTPRELVGVVIPTPEDRCAHRPATPIAELCARRGSSPEIICEVVFKSQPTLFKNGTGESIAFEFKDSSGRIRAIAFSPDCHVLDARIEIGGRYRIRGGRCKKADARFDSTGHEYELILDANVRIADASAYSV